MGAAAWTEHATDITEGGPPVWSEYLTVEMLSDAIGLAPATIMDALTRRPTDTDPRHAIYRPAARIGQTRVAAVPMWGLDQAHAYNKLHRAREIALGESRRSKTVQAGNLPVYNVAAAAEKGLASTEELAEITGVAENTLRRWARENTDFPPEVGIAERVPPYQYGPPRTLREIGRVNAWIKVNIGADANAAVA